jgi:hypothetical protein
MVSLWKKIIGHTQSCLDEHFDSDDLELAAIEVIATTRYPPNNCMYYLHQCCIKIAMASTDATSTNTTTTTYKGHRGGCQGNTK